MPDHCLLVHDETLVHLGTARHCGLAEADDLHHPLHPERLAEAARHLLPDSDARQRLVLCLPPHEFAATWVSLPGVAPEQVYNAARLQLPMLLPGVGEALLLAIQPVGAEARYLALWLPARRAEALFDAFLAQGLFLAYLLPRPLAGLGQPAQAGALRDEDRHTLTWIEWRDNGLERWLHLPRDEYQAADFQGQFEEAAGATENSLRMTDPADWERIPAPPAPVYGYAFIPPGATRQLHATRLRHRRQWLSAAAIGLLALIGAAIGGLWYYQHSLAQQLANLQQRTSDTSELRADILRLEEDLGPLRNFPRQDMVGILQKLNALIPKDSWISSLKIEGGVVEFEGQSPNPTGILEALTAQPEFGNVAFSKPLQGQQFGISFRQTGIDVPAYIQEYLPAQNQ
jgi:hypothetical protein